MGTVFTRVGLLITAALHLLRPQIYDDITPDWVPAARLVIYLSGAAEAATALGALHPRTRQAARWLGIATMVGVFPSHVHMLQHAERYPRIPRWALWARLPLQGVFIRLIWTATR
ncbi:hypothetical protein EAH80_09600 [Mycobacterium hodleri]|uniref:DoxX family protein n=1 Tax=Mycolicibacterium hodleri TaxID=49897 RepID=A0A502EC66_9MYCO|nr:hypothetical protein EAH80_09600 [Mycolicibacterium hodleri]